MEPEILALLGCIAVIVAGPQEYVCLAAFGLPAIVVGTILYGTVTIDLIGLTFIGLLAFATRTILVALGDHTPLVAGPAPAAGDDTDDDEDFLDQLNRADQPDARGEDDDPVLELDLDTDSVRNIFRR